MTGLLFWVFVYAIPVALIAVGVLWLAVGTWLARLLLG